MHYRYSYETTFPDPEYLRELVDAERERFEKTASDRERLLAYSGAALNWLADFVLDPHMVWQKKRLAVDDLYLTGTTPEWNKIVLEEAHRSPHELRILLSSRLELRTLFLAAEWNERPILVRREDGHNKVLNGMHRVLAAIRDDILEVDAFVGELKGENYAPVCEPHLVYDLLRAYQRKTNTDRAGLIAALRFLRKAYSNVEELLKHRFNHSGIPDEEIQQIIMEACTD